MADENRKGQEIVMSDLDSDSDTELSDAQEDQDDGKDETPVKDKAKGHKKGKGNEKDAGKDKKNGKGNKKDDGKDKKTAKGGKKNDKGNKKDDGKDKGVTVEELEKKVKEAAATMIAQAQGAIRNNEPGVKLIKVGSLEMTPLLAGYLHLEDTASLRAFIEEAKKLPEVMAWEKSRLTGFGIDGKDKNSNWAIKTLLKFTEDAKFMDEDDFDGGLPLNLEKWPSTRPTRGYASWLVTMKFLIGKFPENFEPLDPSCEECRLQLAGIDKEAWHRAYEVLRNIWREKNVSRQNLKSKDDRIASKAQNKVAVKPRYLTEADYRNANTEEASKLTAGNLALESFLLCNLNNRNEEPLEPGVAPTAAEEEVMFNTFEKSFKSIPSVLAEIDKKNYMPKLDKQAIKQVLAHLAKQARVLHPQQAQSKSTQKGPAAAKVANGVAEVLRRADVEGTFHPEGELAEDQRKEFWDLQRRMNNTSSRPETYENCCVALGLDLDEPKVGKVTLKPWQVTAAWWVLFQWEHGLGNCLLADDVGLGKTIEMLAALTVGVELAKSKLAEAGESAGGEDSNGRGDSDGGEDAAMEDAPSKKIHLGISGPYKPTLIICPASAFGVWKEEVRNFPGVSLKLWAGNAAKAEVRDREHTLKTSVDALRDWAGGFKQDNPATALNVVLTTYQTFHMRTLEYINTPQKKGKGKQGEADDDDEDEPGMAGEEGELSDEQLRQLTSRAPDIFGIVIADESHKLKTVRTATHQAVRLARPSKMALVTATPTINKPADLFGSLEIIYQNLPPHMQPDESGSGPSEAAYLEASTELNGDKLTPVNLVDLRQYTKFLEPRNFLSNINQEANLSAATASAILPVILATIQLRRVKGEIIYVGGQEIVIGGDIPPYVATTIELEMPPFAYEQYAAIHTAEHMKAQPGVSQDQLGQVEGGMDMRLHRTMTHATVHPGLDRLRQYSAAKVATWNEQEDYGFSTFHYATCLGQAPAYRDRVCAAVSIAQPSAKLQWLAGLVLDVCYLAGDNLIVFTSWPTTQWLVELFLFTLGVPTLSIRAAHSRAQRSQTQELFNAPGTKGHVLVTNIRCSATSMNLQKNCWNMMFLDIPESANVAGQAIGRIYRISQKKVQRIYFVTTNHTYDQAIQARAANKMYGQIAGSAKFEFTDTRIARAAKRLFPDKMTDEAKSEWDDRDTLPKQLYEATVDAMKEEAVVKMYTTMFGQRTRRDKWTSRDPVAKDLLKTEQEQGKKITRRRTPLPAKLTAVNLAQVDSS